MSRETAVERLPPEPDEVPGDTSDGDRAGRPVRVLYMEDDAGLARLFQKHLQRAGYEVDLAPDGREGLELYRRGTYDVLAVDYKMPVQDGLEVIQQLAAGGRVPPTIMLTANGDEALAVEALKLGASDYIVKDTAGGYIRLLPSVIEKLLERHHLQEEKAKAQDALRQSEERLRQITGSASDAIVSFGEDGRILFWNRSAETIFGHQAAEVEGRPFIELVPERLHAAYRQQQAALSDDAPSGQTFELLVFHRDGREVPVEVSLSQATGTQTALCTAILRDVTGRHRTQKALQEAARLEATTTLAGGIAHQFNNLLFGVLGNAELLQLRLEDRPDAIGRLEIIRQQAEKASELVRQLLAFARRGQYRPVVMDLNETVREVLHSRRGDLTSGVRLRLTTAPNLWRISADPTQMAQVVLNLVSNAVEALRDAVGTVSITTANVRRDVRGPAFTGELEPGRYVALTVEDDGCGMDAETRAKIFTPFFTTKFQGRGLGLAAVWGILQNHGGTIEVDSKPSGGSTMRIFLPALDSELGPQAPLRRALSAPRGTETVLLVDEEEVFVSVARELMELLGYRVLIARDGNEAVRLARTYPGPIHLVLLDLHMATLTSAQTYPLLVEARPEVKVILCSGKDPDELSRTLMAAGASAFLRKPFGLEVLALEVRRSLDLG